VKGFERLAPLFAEQFALASVADIAHDAHESAVVQSGERQFLWKLLAVGAATGRLAPPRSGFFERRQHLRLEAPLFGGRVVLPPLFADLFVGIITAVLVGVCVVDEPIDVVVIEDSDPVGRVRHRGPGQLGHRDGGAAPTLVLAEHGSHDGTGRRGERHDTDCFRSGESLVHDETGPDRIDDGGDECDGHRGARL